MSTDPRFQPTYQRPTYHLFAPGSYDSFNNILSLSINVAFPVKEIKLSVGYSGYTTNLVAMYATMPNLFPGSEVVAMFTNYKIQDVAGHYILAQNVNEGVISYTFREPQMMMGDNELSFHVISDNDPGVFNLDVMFHFEFLG